MIVPNASITAYAQVLGAMGDGRPRLVAAPLSRPIVCAVVDPSDHARATLAARNIALTRVADVSLAALRGQGLWPKVGDRVTIQLDAAGAEAELLTIAETTVVGSAGRLPGAINVMRWMLTPARDGATINEPEGGE